MILSDLDIERRMIHGSLDIYPYVPKKSRALVGTGEPCASYGLSSAGYDLRLGEVDYVALPRTWQHHEAEECAYASARNPFDQEGAGLDVGDEVVIPPGHMILASSLERVQIPEDCIATVTGKSTHARLGILCNCTPLEPGWRGHVTMTFANVSQHPVALVVGEGVAQVLFHMLSSYCAEPYGDGKYQDAGSKPVGAKV